MVQIPFVDNGTTILDGVLHRNATEGKEETGMEGSEVQFHDWCHEWKPTNVSGECNETNNIEIETELVDR